VDRMELGDREVGHPRQTAGEKVMTGKSGRPVNEDRQTAIDLGFKTYTGTPHSKCGTTERYVSGGGCVHCARTIATEQREARKLLKAQAARLVAEGVRSGEVIDGDVAFGEPDVNPDREEYVAAQEELDEQDATMQDEIVAEARDDAAERSRQALEDLM